MASDRHKELCELAARWLKRPRNQRQPSKGGPACSFAISEVASGYRAEIPDAWGIRTNYGERAPETVIVEVKVSRSDFIRDRSKPHRINPTLGIGNYRYYMAPEGLISPDELPAGWGLVEVGRANTCRVVCGRVVDRLGPYHFDCNRNAELVLTSWILAKISDAAKLAKDRQELESSRSRMIRRIDDLKERLDVSERERNKLLDLIASQT